MDWKINITEFDQLAQQRLPPHATASLQLPLRSIPWKFVLCRYHVAEANRLLAQEFTRSMEQQYVEAAGKVLMQAAGTDEGRRFAEACLYAEAHVIAFAESLHSTADMLAQVLCISLNLDNLFKPEGKRYLRTVVERMDKNSVAPPIVAAATYFLESDEFRYLHAYVNTIKHTSLVDSFYSVGLVPGQETHGLRMAAFKYGPKIWPEKSVSDFIGSDFDGLSSLFSTVIAELIAVVRAQQLPTTSA